MNRFHSIDGKLADFAKNCNAQLSDGREFSRKDAGGYEERRISWTAGEINRMILISQFPFEESSDKESSTWNFINLAWIDKSSSASAPMWQKFLVYKAHFKLITAHIDDLLQKSKENLDAVELKDLKKSITRRGKLKPGLQ